MVSPPALLFAPHTPDKDGEKPGKPLVPPRLGELTATDATSSSLLLHWTVPEGEFDSFVIQYKDRDGPQVVPVEGPQRSALITNLDLGRKYKFVLYGLVGKKRHGPLVAEAKIGERGWSHTRLPCPLHGAGGDLPSDLEPVLGTPQRLPGGVGA